MAKFCVKCGARLSDDALLCTNCGAKTKSDEGNKPIIDLNKISKSAEGVFASNNKNRSSSKKLVEEVMNGYKNELKELGTIGRAQLKEKLIEIADTQGMEEVHAYLNYTLNRMNYMDNRKVEYSLESKMADKLYKAYINDGISRIEKVNGRFLASQTLKLDMIIEQNNTIIQLLKEIRDKE